MTESASARPRGDARTAALALLARREYTAAGLRTRLEKRGFSPDEAEKALLALRREGLQRDERYAQYLFLERFRNGYGPLRIRADLKQQGVSTEHIEQLFAREVRDWSAAAADTLHRRYGEQAPQDKAEAARRLAFLHRRGFTLEQSRALLDEDASLPEQAP